MKYSKIINILLILIFSVTVNSLFANNKSKKKRIAVFVFEDKTQAEFTWGSFKNPGEGITDMVTTELVKSGQYTVIEREEINRILKEQNFSNTDRVTQETATQIGKLLGVELAVMGSVNEFGHNDRKTSLSVGGRSAGVGMLTAVAAIDIRIINTTTGEILAADNVRRSKKSPSLSLSLRRGSLGSVNKFNESIIGKVTREAVDDVVKLVGKNIETSTWHASIITVKNGQVYINSGAKDGVQVGEEFIVIRKGEALIDPDTGISLGAIEEEIGKIKVTDVSVGEGKASICTVLSGNGFLRGDTVQ